MMGGRAIGRAPAEAASARARVYAVCVCVCRAGLRGVGCVVWILRLMELVCVIDLLCPSHVRVHVLRTGCLSLCGGVK
jgi:hypothetical protein